MSLTKRTNSKCCDGAWYDTSSHCCEGGEVVSKVSIWRCDGYIDRNAQKWGQYYDHSLGKITFLVGYKFTHGYICLDGPDQNCISLLSTGRGPAALWKGQIQRYTPWQRGNCKEDQICPEQKTRLRASVGSNTFYNLFARNCNQWAGTCWQ